MHVTGDIECYVCKQPVLAQGLLHIETYVDKAGRRVNYGRCSICYCFHRRAPGDPERHRTVANG